MKNIAKTRVKFIIFVNRSRSYVGYEVLNEATLIYC